MRKANIRLTLILMSLAMIAATFVAIIGGSATLVNSDNNIVAYADDDLLIINESNVNSMASGFAGGSGTPAAPYIIDNEGQFVKAMKDGNSHYKLNKNVLLTSSVNLEWSPAANFTGSFDGDNKTITYAASTNTGGANFGLFSQNSGLIKNVNYVFTGSLHRNGLSNYGAFVGVNDSMGLIEHCNFNIQGMIDVRGNANNQTIVAGGIIGRNNGKIAFSNIISISDIRTYNYVTDGSGQGNTVSFSGGVIGFNTGYVEFCQITYTGSVTASNYHTGSNSSALYSAGGIIGYTDGGTILSSTIMSGGAVAAVGDKATYGVTGGVVGFSQGTFSIIRTHIDIKSSLQTFSAVNNASGLYAGGIVGRLTSSDGQFKDNVIKINIDQSNLLSAKIKGVILGQGNFNIWNKGNVWFIYNFRKDLGAWIGNGNMGTTHNRLDIRGSGDVTGEINHSTGQITMIAEPNYSPLYGWMSNSASRTGYVSGTYPSGPNGFVDTDGSGEYYPIMSTTGLSVEALFLKSKINQAGDLNVLADLTADGGNWPWIEIEILNDIIATGQYTPIGNSEYPFRGIFDGKDYTITYTSSTLITDKRYAGIFGVNSGTIRNINIAFGGEVRAIDEEETSEKGAGGLVGLNQGIISNINMLITSGGHIRSYQSVADYRASAGGLVGTNDNGSIDNVSLTIQGKVHARVEAASVIPTAGGLVGVTENLIYINNVSVAIEGEVSAFDPGNTGTTMYSGGLVGLLSSSSTLGLTNSAVAIRKIGIFGNPGVGGLGNGTDNRGAISGLVAGTQSIDNFWAILDKSEDSISGIKMFGNDSDSFVSHYENRLYIEGGIVQAQVDNSGQISMNVPIGAGEVFAGWFMNKDFTGMLHSNDDGVYGNVFMPDKNLVDEKRYTKVITSIIYSHQQFNDIASFTNQGNDFTGIEFVLGANIDVGGDDFNPIGNSADNKFNGTFNGGGLSLTISTSIFRTTVGSTSVAALFGYVGSDAHIYGFNITVTGTIGSSTNTTDYSAVLVAVNDGTIGLDSPSQKLKIHIDGTVYGHNAAGLVAENNGTIQNVEVLINDGVIEAGGPSLSSNRAGGIVAINNNDGIVKNVKLQYNSGAMIVANKPEAGNDHNAGGGVAVNNGNVHSIAVIMRQELSESAGGVSSVIGSNHPNANVSVLWMILDDPSIDIVVDLEGNPVLPPSSENRLQIYGPGAIEVIVEANPVGDTSELGGMIVIKSVANETSGNRTFYGYIYDPEEGNLLDNSVGVTDYIFTPSSEMKGKSVLSVFALSRINNFNDLKVVSEDVNNGTNPRIVYNLMNNISINGAYTPIGTDANPFNGIFKGNQKTITITAGAPSINGLFGIIGEVGRVEFLNVTIARTGPIMTGNTVGAIASVNNGIIINTNVELNNKIEAANIAGAMVGINNGSVFAATARLKYAVVAGVIHEGSIIAVNRAGGIAGVNNGNIGSDTVQDIKVIFDNGARIRTTAQSSAAGGVVGLNGDNALITNAFLIINGLISASGGSNSAGGIAGVNQGDIHTIFALIEGQGNISATATGVIAGTNSGDIGLLEGQYNNVNVGIYKNIAGEKIGGAVGVMTAGSIVNTFVTIGGNVTGGNSAGGLVGYAIGGAISIIDLSIKSGYSINGTMFSGGLVGYNGGSTVDSQVEVGAEISNVKVSIDGFIKSETTPGTVASGSRAGGLVGQNNASIENALITLNNDVIAEYKGSVAGISGVSQGSNVWVLLSNSIITGVSSSLNTGFNSLKIVGEASIRATFSETYIISFEVMTSTTYFDGWYSDISNGVLLDSEIDYYNVFTPDAGRKNSNFHICFYELNIISLSQLIDLPNYINHHNFFNGVKFTLMIDYNDTNKRNVFKSGTSIVPIGTESNPFNGIFDGNGKTLKFESGSSIGAFSYSGLFGYTGPNSVIKNLVLEIEENVIIGGQNSLYSGVLVGFSQGSINNVLVKTQSTPRAISASRVGGIAGFLSTSIDAQNTWLITHNAAVKASSNSSYDPDANEYENYGVNVMNIIGTGDLDVTLASAFIFTVPTHYNTSFRGYYYDISEQTLLSTVNGIGTVNNLVYITLNSLKNKSFSVSFIRLNIYNYQDLKNFSDNINTYSGFNGVQFVLHNNIIINDDEFNPIGTKTNPFSGIFDGNGFSISFAGISVYGSYPGLFGYINSTGIVRNLIVVSNTLATPNTFGDNNAIYSGLVASYCDGYLNNIIAQVKNETTIYCVNKAGGMVGAIGPNFNAVNAWVVLKEKSSVQASGIPESQINVLYTAGNGSIRLQIASEQVTFTAEYIEGVTDPFYGYIDGNTYVNPNFTLTPENSLSGVRYTAIFLNSTIRNYADLVKLSEVINSGLNYSGVTYSLTSDITILNGYVPIGGLVGNQIVRFRGIFNGNGHTITVPDGVTITGAYAGLFGYIDHTGGIKNLRMEVYGTIGNNLTIYGGSVAGYNDGSMQNIALYMSNTARHHGATGVSGYVGYSSTIADNVWGVNYNARATIMRNNAGRDNGLNSFTILGAGDVNIDFVNPGASDYGIIISVFDPTYLSEWYYYVDSIKTELQPSANTTYMPNASDINNIYYISFLLTEITQYSDILKLAEDVNSGYDFYNISFNLLNDVTLAQGFPGIGGLNGAFSGSFNGNRNTITLPEDVAIEGQYAGVFGRINSLGSINNLKIQLDGTLGSETTMYAGAFAHNSGVITNCIVAGYTATLLIDENDDNAYAGTVVGFDVNSLISNTWGIIASYNNIDVAGNRNTGVNKMKVVGVGRITSIIQVDNTIKFSNDTDYNSETDISGWYRNYSAGAVISNYLGIGTVTDFDQTYYPAVTVINAEFEVIIIKQTIESESDLRVLANDINIGGYDFKNVTFIISSNFTISNTTITIGREQSPFRGILDGNGMTITIIGDKGIFNYNAGTVKNLNVEVAGYVNAIGAVGAIAYINNGNIENCNVIVHNGAMISGETAGALVGISNGTITGINHVTIMPSAIIEGNIVGGAVGITNGNTTDIEVVVNGHIVGYDMGLDDVYAGGAIGYIREGVTRRIVSRVNSTSIISALGDTAYAGCMVGRNRSVLSDSVLFGTYDIVTASGNTSANGEFAGISNSNMANSWMIMRSYTGVIKAVGDGPQSINHLTIFGNGGVSLLIDRAHGSLLFYKDESYSNSAIDGWYTSQDVLVSENPILGNVSSSGEDYAPSPNIMGRRISLVFINTKIYNVQDLINLADAVNGGMSSRYIEFELQNDIDITTELADNIGKEGNGFNFVFNGFNHTISIYSHTQGSNASLFGYIGAAGVIKNLNITIYGRVGDDSSIYAGGIAQENEGLITNCNVNIATQGLIVSNTSGGVVGRNYSNGTIINTDVVVTGLIQSTGALVNNRVGGIAGRNDGLIEESSVAINSSGIVETYGNVTAFAGGIVGQNTGRIRFSELGSDNGSIIASSTGPFNIFAGGLVGSNTGTIFNTVAHAETLNIITTGIRLSYVGGIVGSNKNIIGNTVVYVGDGSSIDGNVKDTGIGLDDSGVNSLVNNSWVIAESMNAISTCVAMNTMLVTEPNAELSLDEVEYSLGNIRFVIDRVADYFAVYDNLEDLTVDDVYLANIHNNVFTPALNTKGYVARARNSNTISSGNELKAFAKAVNTDLDGYLTYATITLTQDIALEGEYDSVGTETRKYSGIFNGDGNTITVKDSTVFTGVDVGSNSYAAVFGYIDGTINNLIIVIEGTISAQNVGGVAIHNYGYFNNIVVYLIDSSLNANQLSSTIVVHNDGELNNIWTVTNNLALAEINGRTIKVRGNGSIESAINTGVIEFTAVNDELHHFAGWTYDNAFVSSNNNLTSSSLTNNEYGVEFASLNIASQADLGNLSRLMLMGMVTNSLTFTQVNDILVTGLYTPVGSIAPFEGIYNGNGYTVTMDTLNINGINAGLFGVIGANASVDNIILMLGDIVAPMAINMGGLAGSSSGVINNIVVYGTDDYNLIIGDNVSTVSSNIWVVTKDEAQATGLSSGKVVVIGEGNLVSTIDILQNEILFTASTDGTDAIFAGWYYDSALYSSDNNLIVSSITGNLTYQLIFITSLISNEEEYNDFASAVTAGFDLNEYNVSLVNDIVINSPVVAGNLDNVFKGIFDGSGFTITVAGDIDGGIAALFAVNEGLIKDLIIGSNANIGDDSEYAAVVAGINRGEIINVFAVATGTLSATLIGGITAFNDGGTLINSWYASENNINASDDEEQGNKLLFNGLSSIDIDLVDGQFVINVAQEAGKFIVWYNDSEYSEVLVQDVNLNIYNPDSSLNGVEYAVRAINNISLLGELLVFSDTVNSGEDFATHNIYIDNDIVITDTTYTPIGLSALAPFAGSFDGQGNKITIASDVNIDGNDYNGLFGVNSGIIIDLIVDLHGTIGEGNIAQGVVVADNSLGIIANVAVYINGSVANDNALVGRTTVGTLNNTWYILMPEFVEDWVVGDPSSYIVINGNGMVDAYFDEGTLKFAANISEGIHFAGWATGITLDNISVLSTGDALDSNYIAEFVNLYIYDEDDFINLARVINTYSYDTEELTFVLQNDITTSESYVSLGTITASFNGTLDGNYNVVNINQIDEAQFNGIIAYGEGATIINLAVIRDTAFDTYIQDVIVANGNVTMNNVVLLTPVATMTTGGTAETIIVGDTGDLSTGYAVVAYDAISDGFVVTAIPNSADSYDLRGFYNELDIRIDNETYNYVVPAAEGNTITIKFKLRYYVTFNLIGVLSGEASINTPQLAGEGLYWYDEEDVTLEITGIGNGYLFRGIRLKNDDFVLMDTSFTYIFPCPSEDETYEAVFELISFAYLATVYNATRQEQEVSNANLAGLSVTYMYEGIDGTTYALSADAPIDVGNYKVTANITNLDLDLVGIRTVGYQITPAPLTITVLNILDKDYDTTAAAEVHGGNLAIGFNVIAPTIDRTDSASDISLSDVLFAFSSANAGTWDIIVINNTLLASASAGNPDTFKNYWFGTELNQVVFADGSAVQATIRPLDIDVMALNHIKTYGEPDPDLSLIDSAYYILNPSEALDIALAYDGFNGSLSREGGENVGVYKINRGTLSLSNNYILTVFTTGAELTIIRRIVELSINAVNKQYGAVDPIFTYTITQGNLVGSDKLNLVWDYPRNALPSETPYNVEALFNPVTNPNYDIISPLVKSVSGITCKYIIQDVYTVTLRDIYVNVTANNAKEYESADLPIRVSFINNLVGHYVEAERAPGEIVGQYPISFRILSSGVDVSNRYNIIHLNEVGYYYSITPKIISVIPSTVIKVYGEDEAEIPFTVNTPSGVTVTGNLSRAQGNAVDEYPIELGTLTVSDNNYELRVSGQSQYIILPRTLTVTIQQASKVFGDADPDRVDFVYDGLVTGDTIDVSLSSLSRIDQGEVVGAYTITGTFDLTGAMSQNYQINIVNGTLSVVPRSITIATSDISMVYGSSSKAVNANIIEGELVGDDTLSSLGISYENFSTLGVGTYDIAPTNVANENYTVETQAGTLTITKRKIEITVQSISKIAGDEDPIFEYTITSGKLVNRDKFSGNLARDEGEKPGTYAITEGNLRLSRNYNLEIVLDDAVLTIERAPISIVPIAVASGSGAIVLGAGFGLFTLFRKLRSSRIPI